MNVIEFVWIQHTNMNSKLKRKNAPKEQINSEFKLNTQIKTRNK